MKMGRAMIVLVAICLCPMFSQKVLADTFARRLAGKNRYETASEIIQYGWPDESSNAVLVSGGDYPDALSAASLAKKYDAPVMITDKDSLNENTAIELKRLNVKNVFIVGGYGAVSKNVEQALASMNIEFSRIHGNDRYSTAVEVAKTMESSGEIFLVSGSDFKDALSVAPIAAKEQIPVLLTTQNEIPACVKQYINEQKITKVFVIGDGSTISDKAVSSISGIVRIGGKDIYERNINIIEKFIKDMDLSTIYIASGESFADALSGAGVAAHSSSPIILTSPEHTDALAGFMKNRSTLTANINILGGEGVLPLESLKKSIGSVANYPHEEEIKAIKNISTGEYVTQGEWVYYSSFNKQDEDGLYRIKTDGSMKEKLDSGVINGIYVDGEIVYYNNGNKLYTIKIDGTSKQLFMDDLVTFIKVKGEWIYYSDSKGIFKIKKDDSEKRALVLGYADCVSMDGSYIYYNYAIKDMICKIDINGDNYKGIVNGNSYILYVNNDYIYYKDYKSGKIYRASKADEGKMEAGKDELEKLETEIGNEFTITNKCTVYDKCLNIKFSKPVLQCNDVDKIKLIDADGNKIDIKQVIPDSADKYTILIVPAEKLQKDTKYTLFVPEGTIQSENGEFYNKFININFETN